MAVVRLGEVRLTGVTGGGREYSMVMISRIGVILKQIRHQLVDVDNPVLDIGDSSTLKY